eukprot:tig00000158_g10113.t1
MTQIPLELRIKQEPEDLLTAAASAPKQRRRRGPKSLCSEPEILAAPARGPETVDLTLEEPARGPPRLLILAAAAAALYYAARRLGPQLSGLPHGARGAPAERVERGLTPQSSATSPSGLALMAGRMLDGNRLEPGHRLKLEDGGTALWGRRGLEARFDGRADEAARLGNKYWRGDSMDKECPTPRPTPPQARGDAFATENERSLMRVYEALREAIYWEDPRLGTLMNFAKFAEFMFAMTVPFTRVVLWDRNRNW